MDWDSVRELVQTVGAVFAIAGGIILILRFRAELHVVHAELHFSEYAVARGLNEPPYGELEATISNGGRDLQVVKGFLFVAGAGHQLGEPKDFPRWMKRGEHYQLKVPFESVARESFLVADHFDGRVITDADLMQCLVVFSCGERHEHTARLKNPNDVRTYLTKRPRGPTN